MDLFTITEFDELLDSAEPDERLRMKARVREVIKFELQHVPPELAAELASSRLEVLGKAFVAIVEKRDSRNWYELMLELRDDLRKAIERERVDGRLKPWSAAGEIEKNLVGFAKWRYEPRLIDFLRTQLRPGETITAVEPREVLTSLRVWPRAELQTSCRTVTERGDVVFTRQFPSEAEIDALIVEDAKNSQPAEVPWASANRSALGPQG